MPSHQVARYATSITKTKLVNKDNLIYLNLCLGEKKKLERKENGVILAQK